MTRFLGLLGVLSISFSAVFIRLAAVSPVTAVFYRAVYAIPVLYALWRWQRQADVRDRDTRLMAWGSGLLLAADLACWHEAIARLGAGLGTVVANVQVVFIALIGWWWEGERPTRRTVTTLLAVAAGIVLTSGLARHDAYGAAPVSGVVFGTLAGGFYAGYLLTFRAANRGEAPRAAPLLDSTLGMAIGALVLSPIDAQFAFAPHWPAHGWLVALAIVGQVLGWLLIVSALSRLPTLETSILLLLQPAFAIIWGRVLFAEQLSATQWVGTLLVLGGVAAASGGPVTRRRPPTGPAERPAGPQARKASLDRL